MLNFLKKFPAFSYRDFKIYLPSQFISSTGSQMQFVALNWHIYELTHSALALGLIGLLRFLPILFFSLIGGSVADAHNRKKVLYITESSLAILSIILAYLTFTKTITPLMIFIITALGAVCISFEVPARQSLVPNLVDKKDLQNALSIFAIFHQTSQILGPALSGLLIANSGLTLVYVFNAISFVIVLIGLKLLNTSGEIVGPKTGFSFAAIKEGLHFVRNKTIIWSTMLLDFFSTFFSTAAALLPIFAKDILHVGPLGLGLLYSAQSIGAVSAGLLLAHKHNLSKQGIILLCSVILYAVGTIIFGLSKIFFISFIALVIIGAGDGISTIIRNTIRQLETPDYIRGRMSSVNMIFFMGGPQLGDFEAGALAFLVGGPLSVIIGGVSTIAIVILMAVKIPTMRNYDKHNPKSELLK